MPNESRTAIPLFDDYQSEFYSRNGFYGSEDFLHLANLFGIQHNRAERMLLTFPQEKHKTMSLIGRSFLSIEAKNDYASRLNDRLLATVFRVRE